jgi:hypothetical protein
MKRMVVAHMGDGRLFKGTTSDFQPGQDKFTVDVTDGPWQGKSVEIELSRMKALFFVRSLKGNRDYQEKKMMRPTGKMGKRVVVTFKDGETIRGTATGLNLKLPGFYLFPADPQSNNKRIYIVRSSAKEIKIEM